MARIVVSVVSLGALLFWLIFSYVPASIFSLPTVAYGNEQVVRVFGLLLAVGLIGFVAIQGWLVNASARMFRSEGELQREEIRGEFAMRRSSEVFWTLIPLLMTGGLALLCYPTWKWLFAG